MYEHRLPESNHKAKPQQRVGYTRGTNYDWKNGLGLMTRLLLWLVATNEHNPDVVLKSDRKWAKYPRKLTGEVLYARIKQLLPAVFEDYKRVTGQELTPGDLHGRLFNMYYNRKKKSGERDVLSTEHPLASVKTRAQLPAAWSIYCGGSK